MERHPQADIFDELTLEVVGEGRVAVYGHTVYEASSVLAGRHRRVFLDQFDNQDAALTVYPEATPSYSTREAADASCRLPASPPAWFDPMDAGEEW